MKKSIVYINGHDLNIETAIQLMSDEERFVELDDHASMRCSQTRGQIDQWLGKDAPVIYGINTGLGNLKDTVMSPEEHIAWNKTIPYPHAVGLGNTIDPDVTRTALLIRANVLARGYSAVRVELIERMLDIYNARISPVVYEMGSTGLSDLGPLAQSAMVVAGLDEAEVFYRGQKMPAQEAFELAGLDQTFSLECKEVLAQMNGSTMTQSLSVLTYHKFERQLDRVKDLSSLADSSFIEAVENTKAFIKEVINFENNITCDNPLLFEVDNGQYEAVMGCNCSNTQVGYVMDLLTIMMCDLSICYYNSNQWDESSKDQALSYIAQIDTLKLPACADSIATKGNQEDHVEFSYGASRKANKAVQLLERLIAL